MEAGSGGGVISLLNVEAGSGSGGCSVVLFLAIAKVCMVSSNS